MTFQTKKFYVALPAAILSVTLTVSWAFAAQGKTFTGTVSDSMCGAKHAMSGDDAGCTRACVSKGSKYASIVGEKVYTLDTDNKEPLSSLHMQAGRKVTVTGSDKDNTIPVQSV